MKRTLTIFFVTLGVIFFVLILTGTYLFVTDPYDLKPLFYGTPENMEEVEVRSTSEESQVRGSDTPEDTNPLLNETQEEALRNFGVDPAAVPSEISPEQERCFREVLGDERVDEIIAGGSPTPTEFFQVRGCI